MADNFLGWQKRNKDKNVYYEMAVFFVVYRRSFIISLGCEKGEILLGKSREKSYLHRKSEIFTEKLNFQWKKAKIH